MWGLLAATTKLTDTFLKLYSEDFGKDNKNFSVFFVRQSHEFQW